jgi:hypothetical protein
MQVGRSISCRHLRAPTHPHAPLPCPAAQDALQPTVLPCCDSQIAHKMGKRFIRTTPAPCMCRPWDTHTCLLRRKDLPPPEKTFIPATPVSRRFLSRLRFHLRRNITASSHRRRCLHCALVLHALVTRRVTCHQPVRRCPPPFQPLVGARGSLLQGRNPALQAKSAYRIVDYNRLFCSARIGSTDELTAVVADAQAPATNKTGVKGMLSCKHPTKNHPHSMEQTTRYQKRCYTTRCGSETARY